MPRKKSKHGMGRLYKRNSEGCEYKAAAKVHGMFWLKYRVAGKRVREPLINENNEPITNRQKAETARHVAGVLPAIFGRDPPRPTNPKLPRNGLPGQ